MKVGYLQHYRASTKLVEVSSFVETVIKKGTKSLHVHMIAQDEVKIIFHNYSGLVVLQVPKTADAKKVLEQMVTGDMIDYINLLPPKDIRMEENSDIKKQNLETQVLIDGAKALAMKKGKKLTLPLSFSEGLVGRLAVDKKLCISIAEAKGKKVHDENFIEYFRSEFGEDVANAVQRIPFA